MFITFEINEVEPRKLLNECHIMYLNIPIYDEKYPCCNIPVLCRVEMSLKGTSEVWVTYFKTFLFLGISFYRQRIGRSLWCDWFIIVLVWKPMDKIKPDYTWSVKQSYHVIFKLIHYAYFWHLLFSSHQCHWLNKMKNCNFPLAILKN